MPAWPMAMPSSTPMVLNSKGTPPALRISSLAIWPYSGQVEVAGDDVDLAVADADERLVEVRVHETGGAQQAAVGGPLVPLLDDVASHGARGTPGRIRRGCASMSRVAEGPVSPGSPGAWLACCGAVPQRRSVQRTRRKRRRLIRLPSSRPRDVAPPNVRPDLSTASADLTAYAPRPGTEYIYRRTGKREPDGGSEYPMRFCAVQRAEGLLAGTLAAEVQHYLESDENESPLQFTWPQHKTRSHTEFFLTFDPPIVQLPRVAEGGMQSMRARVRTYNYRGRRSVSGNVTRTIKRLPNEAVTAGGKRYDDCAHRSADALRYRHAGVGRGPRAGLAVRDAGVFANGSSGTASFCSRRSTKRGIWS